MTTTASICRSKELWVSDLLLQRDRQAEGEVATFGAAEHPEPSGLGTRLLLAGRGETVAWRERRASPRWKYSTDRLA
jgi:hypothetical protein